MLSSVSSRVLRARSAQALRPLRAMSVTAGLDLKLPSKFGHFINGEFVEPAGGQVTSLALRCVRGCCVLVDEQQACRAEHAPRTGFR